jgi:hypothetical protein
MEKFVFGSLGAPEVVIVLLVFALPIFILWKVASARGQTHAYALWGILGFVGLIVGLLIMMAMPRKADVA